jgi:hypothetical protein
MRVLLDACVPKGLRKSLAGHEVRTAHEMGWGDLDNGDLLDAMTGQFDALVTVDKGLPGHQHIEGRPLGVAVLRAKSNRLTDLLPLVPDLLKVLLVLKPGTAKEVPSASQDKNHDRNP